MKNLFDGRLRWLLIFWMFLMSAIAYLDRVNVSIAGQAIQKDFNLSNVQLGYVFSAFVIGYALFQSPVGHLADKYGPRFIIAAGVVWWGVFTTLTAWVPTTLAWSDHHPYRHAVPARAWRSGCLSGVESFGRRVDSVT